MPLLLIAALIVAFLAVVFALQNSVPVEVSLGIWRFEASLAIVLLITLAIGLFVGLCVAIPALIRRGLRISRQKKQIAQLQSELVEAQTESPESYPTSPMLASLPSSSEASPSAQTRISEYGGERRDAASDATDGPIDRSAEEYYR
ncbi:MAG: lipopolysaccharide assembly LapA domain-containing protein [Elainellaceae cyanobacterium]